MKIEELADSLIGAYEIQINKFYDNNEIDILNAELEPLSEDCVNFLKFIMSDDWKNHDLHKYFVRTLLVYMLENSENAKE